MVAQWWTHRALNTDKNIQMWKSAKFICISGVVVLLLLVVALRSYFSDAQQKKKYLNRQQQYRYIRELALNRLLSFVTSTSTTCIQDNDIFKMQECSSGVYPFDPVACHTLLFVCVAANVQQHEEMRDIRIEPCAMWRVIPYCCSKCMYIRTTHTEKTHAIFEIKLFGINSSLRCTIRMTSKRFSVVVCGYTVCVCVSLSVCMHFGQSNRSHLDFYLMIETVSEAINENETRTNEKSASSMKHQKGFVQNAQWMNTFSQCSAVSVYIHLKSKNRYWRIFRGRLASFWMGPAMFVLRYNRVPFIETQLWGNMCTFIP